MPVRLVAITDRRSMVAAELLATEDWPAIGRAFAAAITRAVPAGAVVQVREKDLDGGPLLELVRAAVATGARVMVNDRVDVALAGGAHGVHLPERGLAIAAARGLVAGRDNFTIGVSCHSVESACAAAAAGADLVQLGPIWDTPNKGPPLGPSMLGAARAGMDRAADLVAVGGIDSAHRAREALGCGADAVAAIRAVWSGELGRTLTGPG